MERNSPIIDISSEAVCADMEELFASKTFAQILNMFNERKRANNSQGKAVTKEDIKKDFALAGEFRDFWRNCYIQTRVGDFEKLSKLVEITLEHIRKTNYSKFSKIIKNFGGLSPTSHNWNVLNKLMEIYKSGINDCFLTDSALHKLDGMNISGKICERINYINGLIADLGLEIEKKDFKKLISAPFGYKYRLRWKR